MHSSEKALTEPQNELFEWIRDYMNESQHSPSIRQMMKAMGLKSPAPIQSRLKHLQENFLVEIFLTGTGRRFTLLKYVTSKDDKTISYKC